MYPPIVNNTAQNINIFKAYKSGCQRAFRTLCDGLNENFNRYGLLRYNNSFVIDTFVQDSMLKAWDWRSRIESLEHFFFFVRKMIRWRIGALIETREGRYYAQTSWFDDENSLEDYIFSKSRCETENYDFDYDKNIDRLHLAMRYLPDIPKRIMALHIVDGLSPKDIANRTRLSHQCVTKIIEDGTLRLQTILVGAKRTKRSAAIDIDLVKHLLSNEQARVYILRVDKKLQFDKIASQMNTSIGDAVILYADAHNIIKQYKANGHKEINDRPKNTPAVRYGRA